MAREDTWDSPTKRRRIDGGGGSSCSSAADADCCGICLSSASARENFVRGRIDCCDHCFCFMCIREWAKVESTCPLCKRRFSAICRPAVEGLFDTEKVIDVPIRDQVYDPLGIRVVDPYAECKCSVCNGSQDESLLLLCDLCDCASHAYCVGLGNTVPMEDWFCPDCVILRAAQNDGEETDGALSSLLASIVREDGVSKISGSVTDNSPSRIPSCPVSDQEGQTIPASESKVPALSARTRHRSRDVHSRVQALRENWDAIRRGLVDFSSRPIESVPEENSQRDRLGKASSSHCGQVTNKGGDKPESSIGNKGPYDVRKAWRMMDLVKSRQRCRGSRINDRRSTKDRVEKGNASLRGGSTYQNPQQLRRYHTAGQQKQESRALSLNTRFEKGGTSELPLGCERISQFPDLDSVPVSCANGHRASQDIQSFKIPPSNPGKGSSHAAGVKSEIQSIVKQNLKLLTRGKHLGVDLFKEIARISTHNILAACHMEHCKSILCSSSYSFPSLVCLHLGCAELQREASPMPNSCRECFEALVKNVVGSIFRERTGCSR